MFGRGYGDIGFRGCGGLFYGGGVFHIMGMILLVVLAVLLINYIMKNSKSNSTAKIDTDAEVLEILKRRYALGEITEEEYIQKRNVLINKKTL